MKKAMLHTKVSVKLRKSELRAEWYLYLEAYPVFKAGYDKPQREREYLNRIITTPMWDKSRPACLNANGEQSYMPKRDQNGIIVCRSKNDRETCIFADNVRNIRQHEYDNAELYYSETQKRPYSLSISRTAQERLSASISRQNRQKWLYCRIRFNSMSKICQF